MRIEITVMGGSLRERALAKAISLRILKAAPKEDIFSFLQKKSVSLAVVLSSELTARRLNYAYRKKHKPTNVLSFPVYPNLAALRREKNRRIELGDLVLCLSVIRHEARTIKKSFYTQFSWCIAHGILHIAGLDHERGRNEARRMERLEQRLLKGFPRA